MLVAPHVNPAFFRRDGDRERDRDDRRERDKERERWLSSYLNVDLYRSRSPSDDRRW